MKKSSLREKMPKTAKLIDDLREVFGKEYIDDILRSAMRGEPDRFYAEENGMTFGTPFSPVDRSRCMRWSERLGGMVPLDEEDGQHGMD